MKIGTRENNRIYSSYYLSVMADNKGSQLQVCNFPNNRFILKLQILKLLQNCSLGSCTLIHIIWVDYNTEE